MPRWSQALDVLRIRIPLSCTCAAASHCCLAVIEFGVSRADRGDVWEGEWAWMKREGHKRLCGGREISNQQPQLRTCLLAEVLTRQHAPPSTPHYKSGNCCIRYHRGSQTRWFLLSRSNSQKSRVKFLRFLLFPGVFRLLRALAWASTLLIFSLPASIDKWCAEVQRSKNQKLCQRGPVWECPLIDIKGFLPGDVRFHTAGGGVGLFRGHFRSLECLSSSKWVSELQSICQGKGSQNRWLQQAVVKVIMIPSCFVSLWGKRRKKRVGHV